MEEPLYNYYGRLVTYAEIDLLSDRFAALLPRMGATQGDGTALARYGVALSVHHSLRPIITRPVPDARKRFPVLL